MPKRSLIGLLILIVIAIILVLIVRRQTPADYYSADSINQLPVTPTKSMDTTTPSSKTLVTLETSKGTIVLELDTTNTPNTAANFAKLAKAGFYDGTKFHRVIEGFMIQGGDPLTKDDSQMGRWGTGGPDYRFNDEIKPTNRNDRGTISMANAGPNTNGSQFFINLTDNDFLDPKHTVFGHVVSGMDVVDAIAGVDVGPNDRPMTAVVVTTVTVKEE